MTVNAREIAPEDSRQRQQGAPLEEYGGYKSTMVNVSEGLNMAETGRCNFKRTKAEEIWTESGESREEKARIVLVPNRPSGLHGCRIQSINQSINGEFIR